MINLLCGAIAIIGISLFVGGLAYSIWDNTGSIAFPIIAILVLLMAYKSAFDEFVSGPNHA
jgi:hypothetical protein